MSLIRSNTRSRSHLGSSVTSAWAPAADANVDDLTERLHPVVEQVLIDTEIDSTPEQLELVVAQLARELRRDLGVN